MKREHAWDFYEIQSKQWEKSLFIFFILILFYLFSMGFISSVILFSLGLFLVNGTLLSGEFLTKFYLIVSIISLVIASFHFFEAKKFGAAHILKRLRAKSPNLNDRYHKRFINTVEEIRLASGLPKVTPYIISEFAINSMAITEAPHKPAIIVTEGLMAEYTRDELQAVVAHEVAHIIRGDSFYLTLVCSLGNFIEKIREAFDPQEDTQVGTYQTREGSGWPIPAYIASTISVLILRLISTLISRQREILADAAAVELCRNPKALARAIYKAHLKNSFVGDFNLTYSPLFIVPPESKGKVTGFYAKAFNSHPPLMDRIRLLASMSNSSSAEIIKGILEIRKQREKYRNVIHSPEESDSFPSKTKTAGNFIPEKDKIWSVKKPGGKWIGPLALQELLFLRFFTPGMWIKNLQEGIEAPALEFPHIQEALRRIGKKSHLNPSRKNRCPRCNVLLKEIFYEGVNIKICPQCKGKLIDSGFIERIIARKEVTFSDYLINKAHKFKEEFLMNPVNRKKISSKKCPAIFCPECGSRMLPRPYNYQYVIPVNKCYSCSKIWFDTDELDILQILIEQRYN